MNRLSRYLMLALALLASTFTTTQAAPDKGKTFKDWTVSCEGKAAPSKYSCKIGQNIVNKEKKALIAAIRVGYTPKVAEPVVLMALPLNVNLSGGAVISVDNNTKKLKVPYRNCTQAGCFALVPLGQELMAQFKAGQKLDVIFQPMGRKPLKLSFSLSGFSAALANLSK